MLYKKIIIIIIILTFFPVTCYADDYINDTDTDFNLSMPTSNNVSNVVNINARHSVVLDRNSKSILFGKNENEMCKMASTTKILTAIIVLEHCSDLDVVVVVSKKAARYWRFKTRANYRRQYNNQTLTLWIINGIGK